MRAVSQRLQTDLKDNFAQFSEKKNDLANVLLKRKSNFRHLLESGEATYCIATCKVIDLDINFGVYTNVFVIFL